jgi:hypothetical protein
MAKALFAGKYLSLSEPKAFASSRRKLHADSGFRAVRAAGTSFIAAKVAKQKK